MSNSEKPTVIAIVGATATGKTGLSIELAKELNTQIVSADSRLVYKELNIGTAKPSMEERKGIKHHCIDIVTPSSEEYSLAKYIQDSTLAIDNILNSNQVPVITGGTGLYFRGILEGMTLTNVPSDSEYREYLENNYSVEELYNLLLEISPDTTIHHTNRQRIIRLLEINKYKQDSNFEFKEEKQESKYNTIWSGLLWENRELLRDRIKQRVKLMLSQGLIEETESLINKYGKLDIFYKTIGYKECIEYIENKESITQDELIEKISISSSQYAKRQMTWFRANKNIHWLDGTVSIKDNLAIIHRILDNTF